MDDSQLDRDLMHVLVTKEELAARISELAIEIDRDYAGKDLLMVGVLNGAVMVMADLSRALTIHCRMDWMAVSSYGSGSQSSGVVRILKDLSTDVTGLHVLLVEDIIDTGHMARTSEVRSMASTARRAPWRRDWTIRRFRWTFDALRVPVARAAVRTPGGPPRSPSHGCDPPWGASL